MDNVLKADLKAFLTQLRVTLQVELSEDDKKIIFDAWMSALEGTTLIEFERAKKRLLQEWKYAKFPKPADLIDRMDRVESTPVTDFAEKPKSQAEIRKIANARDRFFKKHRKEIEDAKRQKQLHAIALGQDE